MSLSIVLPVYNEEKAIKENLPIIYEAVKKLNIPFEILMCDNGSKDNTKTEINKFKHKEIIYHHVKDKGLGLGIKLGIKNAKYENIMFYAIDLPFGTKIIKQSLDEMKNADIVIGSKSHKKSINNHPFKRKIFSFLYNTLINFLFNLKVKDTQGSLMFKSQIKQYLKHMTSKDAFFETEILIYGKHGGMTIKEIPVVYKSQRKGSKINIVEDGIKNFKQIIQGHKRFKQIEKR